MLKDSFAKLVESIEEASEYAELATFLTYKVDKLQSDIDKHIKKEKKRLRFNEYLKTKDCTQCRYFIQQGSLCANRYLMCIGYELANIDRKPCESFKAKKESK